MIGMPRLTPQTFKAGVAAALLAGALVGIAPGGASASTCVSWTGSQPPNPGADNNDLNAVAVRSACNAWAVGYYAPSNTTTDGLTVHWNGSAWNQVPVPGLGRFTRAITLNGVAAPSARSAWAVGYYYRRSAGRTLILHWNGKAWKHLPSPSPSATQNALYGVAALSARNAWAVGEYASGTGDRTLILHWNGKTWKQVRSPDPGGSAGSTLFSVAALSSRDAWAVGWSGSFGEGSARTLILHWNGKTWKQVRSPNSGGSALKGVTFTSARNAWAVGNAGSDSATLTLHWNGRTWRRVRSPSPGNSGNDLTSVTATTARDAWAVGYQAEGTIILHWNGRAWRLQPSSPEGIYLFFGVAAAGSGDIWAVGEHYNGTDYQTYALHCC
jgi:hypothetical protein